MPDSKDSNQDAVLQELRELRGELRALGQSLSQAIGRVLAHLPSEPPQIAAPRGAFFPALCLDVQNQCLLLVTVADDGEKRTDEIIHRGPLFDVFRHILDQLQHRYGETHWAWYPVVFSGPQKTREQMQRDFKNSCRELRKALRDAMHSPRFSFLKGKQGGGGHGGYKILWDQSKEPSIPGREPSEHKEKPSELLAPGTVWERIVECFTVPLEEQEPDMAQGGLRWVWRLLFATHCARQAEGNDRHAWATEIGKVLEIDPDNYFGNVSLCRCAIEHWLDFWGDLSGCPDVKSALRAAFAEWHRSLSEEFEVSTEEGGQKWLIKDQGEIYTVAQGENHAGDDLSTNSYHVYKINYNALGDPALVEEAIAFVHRMAVQYEQAEEQLRGLPDKPTTDDTFNLALRRITERRDTLMDLRWKLPSPLQAPDPQQIAGETLQHWAQVLCSSAGNLNQADKNLLDKIANLRTEVANALHLDDPFAENFKDDFLDFIVDCGNGSWPISGTSVTHLKTGIQKWYSKRKQQSFVKLTKDGNIEGLSDSMQAGG